MPNPSPLHAQFSDRDLYEYDPDECEDCGCEPCQCDELDDRDDYFTAFEESLMNCGMDRNGYCGLAGTEECDFECPYRNVKKN